MTINWKRVECIVDYISDLTINKRYDVVGEYWENTLEWIQVLNDKNVIISVRKNWQWFLDVTRDERIDEILRK